MAEAAIGELHKNLKSIFKHIDEDSSGGITRLEFQKAMPWINRNYPILAKYWGDMSGDDGVLDWEEFTEFTHNKRMLNDMRRANSVACYDVLREPVPNTKKGYNTTVKIYRNVNDPALKSETGGEFDKSIVYNAQRVEWEIEDIANIHGQIPKGKQIRSRTFGVAGVNSCHMKFWPQGYMSDMSLNGRSKGNLPLTQGWCGLGLFAPPGTSLHIRFFIGAEYGEWQHIYFNQGVVPGQLWSPQGRSPPMWDGGKMYGIEDGEEINQLIIGVEVCENTRCPRVPERINITGAKGRLAHTILKKAKSRPKADERRQQFNKPKIDPPAKYLRDRVGGPLTMPLFKRIEVHPFAGADWKVQMANQLWEKSKLTGIGLNFRRREYEVM